MQGSILSMPSASNQGIILGDDGIRYTFTALGWRDQTVKAVPGMKVNFDLRGTHAVGVYPLAPLPGAAAPSYANPNPAPPTFRPPPQVNPNPVPPTFRPPPQVGHGPGAGSFQPLPQQPSYNPPPAPPTASGIPSAQSPYAPQSTPGVPPTTEGFVMKSWHWALAASGLLIILGIAGAYILGLIPMWSPTESGMHAAAVAQEADFNRQETLRVVAQSVFDEQPFALEWNTPASEIRSGESFTLRIRMHAIRQAGEHGGISVSFPSVTEAGGSRERHTSAVADVEALSYTTGISSVAFHQPGATIYHKENNRQFAAEYLLVESDDASWSSSDDRTLELRITPKGGGDFPIQIRGWLCADGYTDCSRHPPSGAVEDQQGWIVERVSVNVNGSS